MSDAHLEHHTIKVRQLIADYRAGKIVIPEFQREYVWRRGKAPKLIDSLYQGFPVSSLLFWNSTNDVRARRNDPRPSRGGMLSWLIDGQQRVITLARTMTGDEGIDVVFSPEADDDKAFQLANAATSQDKGNWFRVAEIWDDDLYRQLRRTVVEGRNADRREERLERVRAVLDYEIPYVRMVDHTFDGAVKAFTRINTLGVRLRGEDIESARVAAQHTGLIADEVAPFLATIRADGFSRMNIMQLFRACAFIAQPDGRSRTPLHELGRTEVLRAWKKTEQATLDAIGLIRSELGLVNMDILWSGALVVPLIALCGTRSPRDRDGHGLAAWLALAAIHHRYSGAAETALDQDLRACRANDPLGGLLGNLRQAGGSLEATGDHFIGALADRSGLLALYVACKNRGVLDFHTGEKILLQRTVERHHILPRGQFEPKERSTADCIANIAFIIGGSNRAITNTGPEVYLPKVPAKIRKSQCVPDDEKLWRVDSAEDFWTARRELLAESFNEYTREALPGRKL